MVNNCYIIENEKYKASVKNGVFTFEEFYQNSLNENLVIPEGVVEIGTSDFLFPPHFVKRITIPDGVVKIASGAFRAYKGLEKVDIPESVREIGENAFSGCVNLSEIQILGKVESLSGTFAGCSSLETVALPDCLKSFEEGVFAACENLTEINIPSELKIIGTNVFKGCKNLSGITLNSGLKIIDESAFEDSGIEKLIIPESVEEIKTHAFADCSKLKEVIIPQNIKVDDKAFERCGHLKLNENYYSGLTKSAEKLADENPFKALQLLYQYCREGYIYAAKPIIEILYHNEKTSNSKWPFLEYDFQIVLTELFDDSDSSEKDKLRSMLMELNRCI